jgi:hypothetical protein
MESPKWQYVEVFIDVDKDIPSMLDGGYGQKEFLQ